MTPEAAEPPRITAISHLPEILAHSVIRIIFHISDRNEHIYAVFVHILDDSFIDVPIRSFQSDKMKMIFFAKVLQGCLLLTGGLHRHRPIRVQRILMQKHMPPSFFHIISIFTHKARVKKGEHGKQNQREEKKENHEEVSMTRVKRREGLRLPVD